LISYLEAKLEGKVKEMEILQHYSRNHPTLLGRKKRKREEEEATTTRILPDPALPK